MILDEENAGAKSSLISTPYFLVFDTNVILDQVSIVANIIYYFYIFKSLTFYYLDKI